MGEDSSRDRGKVGDEMRMGIEFRDCVVWRFQV